MSSIEGGESGVGDQQSAAPPDIVNVQIFIPECNVQKCLQIHNDELVWNVKQKVLTSLSKELDEGFNYGLFLPPCNGRAGKFLLEERSFREYPFQDCVPYLELKYKKRVYKMLKMDEKQLKQIHSKSNLKKFLEHVRSKHVEKVEKMLSQGLDPNFHDQHGETPLTIASNIAENSHMIMTLVSGGAHMDFRNLDGQTPLHRAAFLSTPSNVKTLLELSASPNFKDPLGLTPLYYNMLKTDASADSTEFMLRDYADLGVTDPSFNHEIHQACKNGLVKHLEHLLYYGAEIDAQNKNGNTPLHVCAVNNREACARVLLFRGASRDVVNSQGQTAYHVAIICGHHSVADIIKTHDPNKAVPYRGTPKYNSKRRLTWGTRNQSSGSSIAGGGTRRRSISQSECGTLRSISRLSSINDSNNSGGSSVGGPSSPSPGLPVGGGVHSINPNQTLPTNMRSEVLRGMRKSMSIDSNAGGIRSGTSTPNSTPNGYGTLPMKKIVPHPPNNPSIPGNTNSDVNIARILVIPRGPKGFGFILRGAKKMEPGVEFEPTPSVPALQFFEGVDMTGVAIKAGLKPGDYLLEINGVDVRRASHDQVVQLIQASGDNITLKVVTVDTTQPTQPYYGTLPSKKRSATISSNMNGLLLNGGNGSMMPPPPVPPPAVPRRHPSTSLSAATGRQYLLHQQQQYTAAMHHHQSQQQQHAAMQQQQQHYAIHQQQQQHAAAALIHHQQQQFHQHQFGGHHHSYGQPMLHHQMGGLMSAAKSMESLPTTSNHGHHQQGGSYQPTIVYRDNGGGDGGEKVASIRGRGGGSRRISAAELEQLMSRQGNSADGSDLDASIASHNSSIFGGSQHQLAVGGPNNNRPQPPHRGDSVSSSNGNGGGGPRVYASVAEMKKAKREKAVPVPMVPQGGVGLPRTMSANTNNTRLVLEEVNYAGGGYGQSPMAGVSQMKSFHSSPDLADQDLLRQQPNYRPAPPPPQMQQHPGQQQQMQHHHPVPHFYAGTNQQEHSVSGGMIYGSPHAGSAGGGRTLRRVSTVSSNNDNNDYAEDQLQAMMIGSTNGGSNYSQPFKPTLRPKTPPPPPPPPSSSSNSNMMIPAQPSQPAPSLMNNNHSKFSTSAPPPPAPPPPPPDLFSGQSTSSGGPAVAAAPPKSNGGGGGDCRGITAAALTAVKLKSSSTNSSPALMKTSNDSKSSPANSSNQGISAAALSAVKLKPAGQRNSSDTMLKDSLAARRKSMMGSDPNGTNYSSMDSSSSSGSNSSGRQPAAFQPPKLDFNSDLRAALAKRREKSASSDQRTPLSGAGTNSIESSSSCIPPNQKFNEQIVFSSKSQLPPPPPLGGTNNNGGQHSSNSSGQNGLASSRPARLGLSLKESVQQSGLKTGGAQNSSKSGHGGSSHSPPMSGAFSGKKDSGYTSSRNSLEPSECGDEVVRERGGLPTVPDESPGSPGSGDFPPPPPPEFLQASINSGQSDDMERNRVSMLSQQLEDSITSPPSSNIRTNLPGSIRKGPPPVPPMKTTRIDTSSSNGNGGDGVSLASTLSTLSGCSDQHSLNQNDGMMNMQRGGHQSQQGGMMNCPPPDYDSGTGDSEAEADSHHQKQRRGRTATAAVKEAGNAVDSATVSGGNIFSSKEMGAWTVGDVADWLDSLQLGEYRPAFVQGGVSGADLASIGRAEFTRLGVTRLGHRRDMENSLKKLNRRDLPTS